MKMSDTNIKNQRLKKDISQLLSEKEQHLVLKILSEIESEGNIDINKANKIAAEAFEGGDK